MELPKPIRFMKYWNGFKITDCQNGDKTARKPKFNTDSVKLKQELTIKTRGNSFISMTRRKSIKK